MKTEAPVDGPWREATRLFLRNPSAIAGLVLLGLVLLVAVAGPWVMGADPFEIRAAPLTAPFSEEAFLGTDYLGRDVLTTLVYGGRATLLVGAFAAILSVSIGITLGAMAGHAADGYGEQAQRYEQIDDLVAALRDGLDAGVTVLVKGSRGARMERVVSALVGSVVEEAH